MQSELKRIKEKRVKWLSESGWHGTYRQAKHFYELYQSAKDGHGGSAYEYLRQHDYLRTHKPADV